MYRKMKKFWFISVFCLTGILFLLKSSRADEADLKGYKEFRAAFQWKDVKSMFIAPDIESKNSKLTGNALVFLSAHWPKKYAWETVPNLPLWAFHFHADLDGFLVIGPSVLNGNSVSLLVFDASGHSKGKEPIASFSGDEGAYSWEFGWLRDLNGDHILDVLKRRKNVDANEKGDPVITSDDISARVWDGKSFVDYSLSDTKRSKEETDKDVSESMKH